MSPTRGLFLSPCGSSYLRVDQLHRDGVLAVRRGVVKRGGARTWPFGTTVVQMNHELRPIIEGIEFNSLLKP